MSLPPPVFNLQELSLHREGFVPQRGCDPSIQCPQAKEAQGYYRCAEAQRKLRQSTNTQVAPTAQQPLVSPNHTNQSDEGREQTGPRDGAQLGGGEGGEGVEPGDRSIGVPRGKAFGGGRGLLTADLERGTGVDQTETDEQFAEVGPTLGGEL